MSNFQKLLDGMPAFAKTLNELKNDSVDFRWYKYNILASLVHLRPLISSNLDNFFEGKKAIADIGAADGDLSFYLESLGHSCEIIDYGPTNMNGLKGARYLKQRLSSNIVIRDIDLDSQFTLNENYNLVFFLGILYHLKNPFYVMQLLANKASIVFLSTKIARYPFKNGPDISGYPLAYLVGERESNNDPSNYWIFTEAGLKQLLTRTGWSILAYRTVGDPEASNPQDSEHNQRAFAVLQSKSMAP
jgi:tRNA (mo5U34)-methyltransferase